MQPISFEQRNIALMQFEVSKALLQNQLSGGVWSFRWAGVQDWFNLSGIIISSCKYWKRHTFSALRLTRGPCLGRIDPSICAITEAHAEVFITYSYAWNYISCMQSSVQFRIKTIGHRHCSDDSGMLRRRRFVARQCNPDKFSHTEIGTRL